jgi:hypothetical protein
MIYASFSPGHIIARYQDGDKIGWPAYLQRLWVEEPTKMLAFVYEVSQTMFIHTPIHIAFEDDGKRLWDGHHRVAAALALGLPAIPVQFIDGKTGKPAE